MPVSDADIIKELARRELSRRQSPLDQVPEQFTGTTAADIGSQVTPVPDTGGLLDLGGFMAGSSLAEPIAGAAGIAQTLNPFADPGAGARAVRGFRSALTPELGPEGQELAQNVAQGIPEPVRKALLSTAQRYGQFADVAAQAYGPATGAAIRTLPVAAAEFAGLKGGRRLLARSGKTLGITRKRLGKELREATPSIEMLQESAKSLYDEIDASGSFINNDSVKRLAVASRKAVGKVSGDKARRAPATFRELDDLMKAASLGQELPLPELVRIRRSLRDIIGNPNDKGRAAAGAMLDEVDDFIEKIRPGDLGVNDFATDKLADKLRTADQLWRRAKRAESVEDAVTAADRARSGFENGIRSEFGKLLRGKNARYFTKEERAALDAVVQGGFTANTLRRLGRFGFGEGPSSSLLGLGVGSGLGMLHGGKVGSVLLPFVGIVSRPLAARMQANRARFLIDTIKAGKDAPAIVASYLTHVPVSKRNVDELASLLIDPNIDLASLPKGDRLISNAALMAMTNRARVAELASAAAGGALASSQLDTSLQPAPP